MPTRAVHVARQGLRPHLDQCELGVDELGLLEWLRLSDYRGRALTAILYLNDDWQIQRDGGALRCWIGGGRSTSRRLADASLYSMPAPSNTPSSRPAQTAWRWTGAD